MKSPELYQQERLCPSSNAATQLTQAHNSGLCGEKGATVENLESTSRYLAEAIARDVDIVGFPEMSITGYADPTRYPEAILHLDGPEVAQVLEMTRGQPVTLLAGLIEANPRGKPFITHIAVRDGQLLGCYRKIHYRTLF